MNRPATTRSLAAVAASGFVLLAPSTGATAADEIISPTDPRLVPSPIEHSDPGTEWTCKAVGSDAQCIGDLSFSWTAEPGPAGVCTEDLWSVNGEFARTQTRFYSLDSATGQLLEYKRLIHLRYSDTLVVSPDDDPSDGVQTRTLMTWQSDFAVPGDLDSRVTRKQGIDTWFKNAQGGVFTLDVGQKTTVLSDDLNFHGRWDVHLGDFGVEVGKVCNALGLDLA